MAVRDAKQPIIVIKRIKKGHHAHHGGAWKIAYADFVTAMMAFFLLMWLLGSTSQGDLKGISDYFNAPLKVAMLGGRGAGDATSLIQGGGTNLTRRDGQVKNGSSTAEDKMRAMRAAQIELAKLEVQRLEALKTKVEGALTANPKTADFMAQVKLDLTSDGLRIQIVDDQNRPMFDSGSSLVKSYMRDLLQNIGRVLQETEARVSLSGHTDSKAFSNGQRGYSNWELSADRANASRRELLAGGLSEEKIFRVMGLAAIIPFDAVDADAPINRRISIIVMNKKAEERFLKVSESVDIDDPDAARDLIDADGRPVAIAAAVPGAHVNTRESVGALRALPSGSSSAAGLK